MYLSVDICLFMLYMYIHTCPPGRRSSNNNEALAGAGRSRADIASKKAEFNPQLFYRGRNGHIRIRILTVQYGNL